MSLWKPGDPCEWCFSTDIEKVGIEYPGGPYWADIARCRSCSHEFYAEKGSLACPVCRVPASDGENYDLRLAWSEYNGFLWCSVCNRDYPSCLCVPINKEPDPDRPWVHRGPEAAIAMFLEQLQDAVWQSTE